MVEHGCHLDSGLVMPARNFRSVMPWLSRSDPWMTTSFLPSTLTVTVSSGSYFGF